MEWPIGWCANFAYKFTFRRCTRSLDVMCLLLWYRLNRTNCAFAYTHSLSKFTLCTLTQSTEYIQVSNAQQMIFFSLFLSFFLYFSVSVFYFSTADFRVLIIFCCCFFLVFCFLCFYSQSIKMLLDCTQDQKHKQTQF